MDNVLLIISSLGNGGAERVAVDLSNILKGHHNVHIAIFDGRDIAYDCDATIHDLNMPPAQNGLKKIFNIIKRTFYIRRLKKKIKPSATISFLMGENLVNCITRDAGLTITMVHTNLSEDYRYNSRGVLFKKLVQEYINSKSDKIITVSKGVERDLTSNFKVDKNKILTIYNPCDLNMIESKIKDGLDSISSGNMIVTNVGRLCGAKGQWHLIRAFVRVLYSVPEAELHIVGDGEMNTILKGIARDLGIDDKVFFEGNQDNPYKYMYRSRVFVFPSVYEGFGNVLLEAMACGAPIIAADCASGPREILDDGSNVRKNRLCFEEAEYGILVQNCGPENIDAEFPLTDEEEQLADAIVYMLTNKDVNDRYKIKSLDRVRDFSLESIGKQWEGLICAG